MRCNISGKDLNALEYGKIKSMLRELTFTPMGCEKADALLPGHNLDMVAGSLDETEEALKMIAMKGFPNTGKIEDIRRILNSLKIGADLSQGQLLHVAGVLGACGVLKEYISSDDLGCKSLMGLADGINPYKDIKNEIEEKIISDEEMDDDASPQLYSIRKKIKSINSSIRDRLNSMITSSRYQKLLQDPIITIREGRFVIPVKQEYKGTVSGIVHDQSASGATLFIEPMPIVEMNNEVRQLEVKEKDEIKRILKQLSEELRDVNSDVEEDVDILGELDFIFAKAYLAQKMDAVKPELNEDGITKIVAAKHPLISSNKVVPVDIELGKDFDVLVITGPNTGGKTVSLKTAGLLIIMALSGLYIPAGYGSQVAVYDNIFADIGDEQSIEQSLSTFSSHISNIVRIIKGVGSNSLVLLDELGAGTDPSEGAALGLGILEFFRRRRIKVIATTHYSELKAYALKTDRVENASVEFDVDTLRPTYRLMIGVPGKSNAFLISERLGLDKRVIEKARSYISSDEMKMEDLIMELEKNRVTSEEDKEKAESMLREMNVKRAELDEEKKRLGIEKSEILNEAKDKANRVAAETRREAKRIIKQLKDLNKLDDRSSRDREIERLRKEMTKNLGTDEDDEEQDIESCSVPKDIIPGMDVYIKSIGQDGNVLRKDGDKAEVQAGIMKITVDISDLLESTGSEKKKKKKVRDEVTLSRSNTISPEIDVRGQNLDDALADIDIYLDDAYMSGLKEVMIIHGKGTGVLRNGVKQYLRRNKRVSSFRLGMLREGGDGVTVVKL